MRRTLLIVCTFLTLATGVSAGVASMPDPGDEVAGRVQLDTTDRDVERSPLASVAAFHAAQGTR